MFSAIHRVNAGVWTKIEDALTPLPVHSRNFKIVHHGATLLYLPIGLVTLSLDCIGKVFSSIGSCFSRDRRDPRTDFTAVLDDSRKWEALGDLDTHFDPAFLMGTSTCTWQDSGAENCPDSQWSMWEKKCLPETNRSGKSANLFALYQTSKGRQKITDHLHRLGANSYRFSIEWSHIEPQQGQFNQTNLQIYINFLRHLRDEGIEPMVTLHHFSEPLWFHELGSFEKEENIAHFLHFCEKVFPELTQKYRGKPLTQYICTINEPNVEAFSRYIRGAFSPGYKFRFCRAGQFLLNALKAHCVVYKKLKELNQDIQIGFAHQRLCMLATNPLLALVPRYINRLVNDTVLQFFKTGVFSYKIPFTCHLHEEGLDPKTDFVGVQYYTRPVIGFTGSTSYHEPMTQMPFREDPEGIYEAILEVHEACNVPIFITENGISTHNDIQRERYLKRALYAVSRAQEKIRCILGYYLWSFCDNSEWDMGRDPQKFGAIALNEDGTLAKGAKAGMDPFTRVATANRKEHTA